jgi:hypothetical protein
MNNVTNIYINYTFEDSKRFSRKRVRKASVEDEIVTVNTKIFNIQDIRIMGRKIKAVFPELKDNKIEIIEPIYKKKFTLLNSAKEKTQGTGLNENETPALPSAGEHQPFFVVEGKKENKSETLLMLEKDSMIIQRRLCLDELKNVILSIQNGFLFRNQKTICPDLLTKAAYYIDEINKLNEKLVPCQIIFKKVSKSKSKKSFKCDFCDCSYSNGQALGGHMSRSHPNLSKKYNMKKQIRQEREIFRDLIYKARKELFENHGLDYEKLKDNKEEKSFVRSFRSQHAKEYKDILDRLKKDSK